MVELKTPTPQESLARMAGYDVIDLEHLSNTKLYPVRFFDSSMLFHHRVWIMTSRTNLANAPYNYNEFNGMIISGGWSDLRISVEGWSQVYDTTEVSMVIGGSHADSTDAVIWLRGGIHYRLHCPTSAWEVHEEGYDIVPNVKVTPLDTNLIGNSAPDIWKFNVNRTGNVSWSKYRQPYIVGVSELSPPFSTNWSNYTGSGGEYEQGKFWSDGSTIHVTGVIKRLGSGSPFPFQLPEGYRPDNRVISSGWKSGETPLRVDVLMDGRLQVMGLADSVTLDWLALDIHFPAGQRGKYG